MLGMLIALGVVWAVQSNAATLQQATFQRLVLISLIPAVLAVLVLAIGAKDVKVSGQVKMPRFALRALGRPFVVFMIIVGIFDLGNSSDAFLVLRAQERGMSVIGILGMLVVFNLVYTLVSAPAGSLSDRIGRRRLIIGGWLVYALIYLGFGLAQNAVQVWVLYVFYGLYYGLAYGTSKAMVADLVSEAVRGTAYGSYNAMLGILDLPASLIAGLLWQGAGAWSGFGAAAPFLFGGADGVYCGAVDGVLDAEIRRPTADGRRLTEDRRRQTEVSVLKYVYRKKQRLRTITVLLAGLHGEG